ncbi:DUF4192 domain-containing protein [Streptomyces sp. NPDC059063]|uniref:DUF4192 domain-containing protein n=1 Tax=unclassified Streptomyces TaxID=2593676 RepID=UPI0036752350
MTNHSEPADAAHEPVVTLRTPAELADALPYLLGFTPEDSIVLIALHGTRGRFGGRVRIGIPERTGDWQSVAEQLAQCLVGGSEKREARPEGVVAFLCQEPGGSAGDTSGRQVMARLRPLAQALRTACGNLDVPVLEVVCISDHRYWTYCCPNQRCCPPEGVPLLPAGTSVLAAATAYAGYQVGPAQGQIRARLTPWRTAAAAEQERALHAAGCALVPRILTEDGHGEVAAETLDLAQQVMARFAAAPPLPDRLDADIQDDELIRHDEAAALILGLQDRTTRDRAAEWMEGDEAVLALRLWRALARRCVGAFREHAAAPLTLAGWVAWSLGDLAEGQEALTMALIADPHYAFALLLHPACSADTDPEPIRRILRGERTQRDAMGARGRGRDGDAQEGAEEHGGSQAQGGRETWEGTQEGSGGTGAGTGMEVAAGTEVEVEVGVGAGTTPRARPRPPRSAGRGSRATDGAGTGPGSRAADRAGTGPQNRRRTIRRGARNSR